MLIPGRKFSIGGYRYGFNGKENDNEVKGEENQQDYGTRIYDPRLGRFLSVDPLSKAFSSWAPYSYAMNRPIDGIDLDGLEYLRFDDSKSKFQSVWLKVSTKYSVINNKTIAFATVKGIEGARGELNLRNCSKWLRNYCENYNSDAKHWTDENGNPTIGTQVTWLGSFYVPVVEDKSQAESEKIKTDLQDFAKTPLSSYGRGSVPNVPNITDPRSAGTSSIGGGKLGATILALTQIAKGYQSYRESETISERTEAENEFKETAWRVLTRLQYALDNNLIKKKYLNEKSMLEIANYFYDGTEPNNQNLIDHAKELWEKTDNLYYEENVNTIIQVGSRNGGNTGTKPVMAPVEKIVRKKI
jgi:RHS repeat-associated protein